MKPYVYIITLAVSDLDRAIDFYENGLNLGQHIHGGDHALFQLQGELTLALSLQADHDKIAGQEADSTSSPRISSTSLTYMAESVDEVDAILEKAVQAGGSIPSDPISYDWGYHGHFKDPDGHLWEVAYFKPM